MRFVTSVGPSVCGCLLVHISSWIPQLCIKFFQNLDMSLGSRSETKESGIPYRRKICWKEHSVTSLAVSLLLERTIPTRFENHFYEEGDAVVLILRQGKMCAENHSDRTPSSGRELERLWISVWLLYRSTDVYVLIKNVRSSSWYVSEDVYFPRTKVILLIPNCPWNSTHLASRRLSDAFEKNFLNTWLSVATSNSLLSK